MKDLNRREFLKTSSKFAFAGFSVMMGLSPLLANPNSSKNIFVYYTRTLNTHILVSYAQSLVGGTLWQVQTAKPYPKDYQATVALANEQRVGNILPQLLSKPDLKGFENVIIAAPLWGMDICAPMKSLLNSVNLQDKRLFLIITNAGFSLGESLKSVQKYAKIKQIAGVLDYSFKNYEKIVPNLLSLNQRQIALNKAFDELDKRKIQAFVKGLL